MPNSAPHCAQCGEPLAANARFCPSCGHAVSGPTSNPASSDAFDTQTVAHSTPARSSPSSSTRASREGRFAPGALLAGRYRIVALLGKGGMGEVYRADDLSLEQPVALKFLPPSLTHHPEAVARFRNEVRTARQVSHPNVCRVYDLSEIEGQYVLSMEYVDGEDLASLLRRIGRLPHDKALEIARKLCAGLAAAHEKGVLHRDLKPGNIMLDSRGQVLLTDFGLSGLAGQIEGAEIRNGTPAYMAPEQLSGEEVTVRSDIYALGLVFYEIFTGKLPFESDTLAGLVRARSESHPPSPATLVKDLDPAVERVILRCLQPKPVLRPTSALAVAAALPGGDPLAAALAAGETPSPEMVAAAGEGHGLSPRIAIPLFLSIVAMMAVTFVLSQPASALDRIRPRLSPEVLSQKARELVQRLGYNSQPADDAFGFDWDRRYLDYVRTHDKPGPDWDRILRHQRSPLRFWYRQADSPLTPLAFHDDLLTPGQIRTDDPPPTEVGMVYVILDSAGTLLQWQAMPPQKMDPAKQPTPPDWSALFAAAGVDPSKLQPADPLWSWLEAADARVAWTGSWPGVDRPLRIEAGAMRGKPVYFKMMGPWSAPWRDPTPEPSLLDRKNDLLRAALVLVVFLAAPWLARKNLAAGRGDKRGALRLSCFVMLVHIALWLCLGHFSWSFGVYGGFLVAVVTAAFYGIVIWTVYLAAEPYVRRRWPQCLISWTSVLAGRIRDPIVGRDILVGVAAGASIPLVNALLKTVDRLEITAWSPSTGSLDVLSGLRATVGIALSHVPEGIRDALVFVFLVFLLRVLLRKQWLAGAAFAVVFTALNTHGVWWVYLIGFALYVVLAFLMLRWGLLAMALQVFSMGVLSQAPLSTDIAAWYFAYPLLLQVGMLLLSLWALRVSMGGQRLWKADLFE
jgi:serine/threonine-protein kinase